MQAVEQTPADRRQRPRRRARLQGDILTGRDKPSIRCMLQDYSENGARLNLPGPAELPVTFLLRILKTGEIKTVRTIWRAEQMIGVVF